MEKSEVCSSCGIRLIEASATSFPCPVCGKITIGRCRMCRDQSVKYQCETCGFQGP